ncbi:MAG TPA: acetylornithine deacetylase [Gammaproteobacteria bacterium]|jgi:acetylornithine deacetylase|nr:M20 family metallopeptidase [Arenicellales bacterium]MDP6552643.1 M20 family metallopeptidase [Arenicellales bacterium]MDP6791189.1 M20 family metallopeptidase [Arenicellales bacterium]MDP6917806.1 M20 family metallopeptidase [Arenicellales bacterium]HCX88759.1 acetylornithine deacetylase [Gammaproteobacteria bacterium]|tara:strand:+ start:6790 stop:7986 length:1197 start_codon:yes stop_codon:yes gene_type:complete
MNPQALNQYHDMSERVSVESIMRWLKEMIAIPSENPMAGQARPGHREKEFGEYYFEQMHQLGMTVGSREAAPGRPNVFGTRTGKGERPSLMLCGHLDTVPTEGYEEPFVPHEKDGRVYGRGSCDMKAGLACYLEVVRLLRDADVGLSGSLILCGVADEEWQMIGSREIGRNGPFADQCIIGEPSDLAVCPAHKGQFGLFIRTFGKAVHSSIPEQGENAIERMARVVNALSDYNEELASREPHPLCGHGTYIPGVIRGGDLASAVPDFCELEIDRRLLPSDAAEDVCKDITRRLEPLKQADPGFRYELSEPSWDIPANDLPVGSPVVQSLLNASRELTGQPEAARSFPGATDAPHLKTPAVVCGPGSLAQAHSLNEFVEVEQCVRATRMYLRAVCDLLI